MGDITYCNHHGCKNFSCARHPSHLNKGDMASFSMFTDCSNYQQFLKELAEQEERDVWAEAKRDMYRLDDNEDTLKYRGGY